MNNQDIPETQVRIANENEKNPSLVSLEGHKSEERKSSAKERQESSSSLIPKLHPRSKKKRRKRESSTDSSSSREISPKITLYPAKKKKYGKRRRRNHTSTSRDSSSSDGNVSNDSQHARFKIVTEDEKFKWKLPKGMASYAKKYFEKFIPEGDLKESILTQSPVPENMDTVKKLDDFYKDPLKEKKKTNEQNLESIFEKLQNKTRDVMCPLAKLWKILEDAKQVEDEAVQISVKELFFYVEQIVLLLGQSSNAITYHRRLNVLEYTMNSQYQVKTMLKEKAALLQKHDSKLFGKKFRNLIADTIKSKRETREIVTDSKKSFPWSSSYPPRRTEGQKVFLTKGGGSNYGKFNHGCSRISQQIYGKCKFFKQNFLQHEFSSRNKLKMGIRKCSPIHKKVVLHKRSSKRSNSRKTKTFLKGLEKINQRSEYPGFSRWLCNSFSKETFSNKDSFPTGSKSRTTKTYGQGREGNAEEGGNETSQNSKRRVLKQFVPCKKEGRRAKASNKSETSKCVYTIKSLQNGRIAKSNTFVTRERLYVQVRCKGAYYCVFLQKISRKYVRFR